MENTCFRDPVWLQHNSLTQSNVLVYFSFSQFYDRNSNNEVLRMQTINNPNIDADSFLTKMTGVQYCVHHEEAPFLFVIKKCERLSPEKLLVLDYFYVMHGTIYQAPTEKEVSRTRYTNMVFSMMSTLNDLPFKPVQQVQKVQSVEKKKSVSSSRLAGLVNLYYTDYLGVQ
ncbi:mediator of RNA polymerase II transcription subunit 6 [Nematocida sp. AWRm77]|nr:mediator of RNA polymerase II transcription subunit 6 [Nematocida sp. AWRm77]